MFRLGLSELIVVGIVIVGFNIPVYRAYRRNMETKIPPKVWAAVLLSIFPSPVSGILYTIGLVPALIAFLALIGVTIANELLMHLPLNSLIGYYILGIGIISGILAKPQKDSLSGF